MKAKNFRGLSVTLRRGEQASYRTYMGQQYLVVPVVAMKGDSVVWPLGADGPEFVPAEVLTLNVDQWNNRPVTVDHPGSSANSPTVLEAQAFGQVFNSRAENGSLQVEAWLSKERAEAIGGEALTLYQSIEAGNEESVSIGGWVTLQETSGEHNGQAYSAVWTSVTSDHLAVLPQSKEGACSLGAGCGTNRHAASASHQAFLAATRAERSAGPRAAFRALTHKQIDLRDQFVNLAHDKSDAEIRSLLWDALDATVPGFTWIEEVYSATGVVIYIKSTSRAWFYFSQNFVVSSDGNVELDGMEQPVEMIREFRPVGEPVAVNRYETNGDEAMTTPKDVKSCSGCTCQGSGVKQNEEAAEGAQEGAAVTAITVPAVAPAADAPNPFKVSDEDLQEVVAFMKEQKAMAAQAKEAKVVSILALQGESPAISEATLKGMDIKALEEVERALSAKKPAIVTAPRAAAVFGTPAPASTPAQPTTVTRPDPWASQPN